MPRQISTRIWLVGAAIISALFAGCLGAPLAILKAGEQGGAAMEWHNLTLPPQTGWVAVWLELDAWCQEPDDTIITWEVQGEGELTTSPWSMTQFILVDTQNTSAHATGAAITYGGVTRWVRVGAYAADQGMGAAVENPAPADMQPGLIASPSSVETGGPCVQGLAKGVERQTGHLPDYFVFLFARHSPDEAWWTVAAKLPSTGAFVMHGGEEDHVVAYQDDFPSNASLYAAGAATAIGSQLDARLGREDAITALAFMPGNDIGAGHGFTVQRTNASMTLPDGATRYVDDWAVPASYYGTGDWTFRIESKARIQHSDAVVFGATVPLPPTADAPE